MFKISNSFVLIIFLLSFLRVFFFNTVFSQFQILSEFLSLIILVYLCLKVKFKKYEIIILTVLIATFAFSFFLLDTKNFFLSCKNILSAFLPLLVFPKLEFDKKFARKILNIFFLVNISLTILFFVFNINISFYPENPSKVSSGYGGLFQSFHYNGFILGVYGISIFRKINLKSLVAGLSIYMTFSKTSFVSYVLSLFFINVDYFLIKIKKISLNTYKKIGFFLFIIAFILFLTNLKNIDNLLILYAIFNQDYSPTIIFDHLTSTYLIKNSFSIFPGNIDDFYKLTVYSEFWDKWIDNEVGIWTYLKTFGIFNFISLCFLLFKNCRKLIIFFFLTSLHISYLFSPLVYFVYFVYSDEKESLD